MPASFPDFPSRAQMQSYLVSYTEHFGLRPFIQCAQFFGPPELLVAFFRECVCVSAVCSFVCLCLQFQHARDSRRPRRYRRRARRGVCSGNVRRDDEGLRGRHRRERTPLG